MLVKKHILTGLVALGLSSISMLANAGTLTLVNNTNQDSTCRINNGACSNVFGPDTGVTKAHTTNVVPEGVVKLACMAHPNNCQADVYMTNDCSGPKIASVNFDVKQGIKNINMSSDQYRISGGGFYVAIDGGPSLLQRLFG